MHKSSGLSSTTLNKDGKLYINQLYKTCKNTSVFIGRTDIFKPVIITNDKSYQINIYFAL